jgi:hypothetical protein
MVQPGDDLEIRRLRVINRYNNSLPITLSSLKLRLDNLLGIGNWEVAMDYPNYAFSLDFLNDVEKKLADETVNMLIQFLPAHIYLKVYLTDSFDKKDYYSGGMWELYPVSFTEDADPYNTNVQDWNAGVSYDLFEEDYTDGY